MTNIKVYKKNDIFFGFEISGHTDFADYGKDVLCATVSGISQAIVLGLKDVCKIKVDFKRDEDSGYLKVRLPKDLDENLLKSSQILIETFVVSMRDLILGYPQYISMEVIE